MRTAAVFIAFVAVAAADEPANSTAQRKQQIDAAWKKLEISPTATIEAANLLTSGTAAEPKLKSLSALLEKQYTTGLKGLQFDPKSPPWPGKLTLLAFGDRLPYRSFCRTIEKRQPGDEDGFAEVAGDWPRLIIVVPTEKDGPTLETTLSKQLAEAMVLRRSGGVKVPAWFTEGFRLATIAQTTPGTASPKRLARKLPRAVSDAWKDGVPAEHSTILWHALAEQLTYGKGTADLKQFLEAFKPPMGMEMQPFPKVLEAVKMTPEQLDKSYKAWLAKP